MLTECPDGVKRYPVTLTHRLTPEHICGYLAHWLGWRGNQEVPKSRGMVMAVVKAQLERRGTALPPIFDEPEWKIAREILHTLWPEWEIGAPLAQERAA